ncbi:uncharacterized protein LOC129568912 [Sitodiplosis mosellana]|uniref:uncharacterized protein LOC129568912 n=1 Tax=Sitodiplosis mosellana TaxID=263140 RepID=UPI002443FCEC|nr:uncharacterized protein LOC129568912 [Sitodiplosis mosellana]
MDINKTGQKLQLSLIAPTWHVIGDRQINLEGKDAEPHPEPKAEDGKIGRYEIDGKNGLPGKPGGAAGHFMGIGNNFFNMENLQINIGGGKGGAGQHGGNGADAKKGDDPEIPAFKSFGADFNGLIRSSRFKWCKVPPFFGVEYNVKGTDGLKAGKGGNGGVGGYGGMPGENFIAGFDNHPGIDVLNNRGDSGADGKGGKGGKEATKGTNVAAQYVFLVVGFLNLNRKDSPKMAIEAGESGIDAESTENLQCAENPDPFINACRTINDYKSYVRGYLPNNIFETKLGEFLAHFEVDQRIHSQYDTLGLVHELQGLERHYIELRDKISLVPFVESLLRRINNYAQNGKPSNDDKIVLNLLNAAALTKLSSIKNRENYASIIHLLAYTQLVRENIKMLRSAKRNEAIQGYQEKFAESVQMKIELANHFIQSQILPDIKRNFTEIDQCIHALIDENGSQQSIIREQELKNALFKQRIWFWIEVIPLLLCLGTTAAAVFASAAVASRFLQKGSGSVASSAAKTALGSGSKLALESSSNASKLKNFSVPMSEIKSTISNLKAKLEDGVKTFKKEFHFLEQKSREYLGNDTVKEMKRKIGERVKETLNSSGVEKNSKDLRANTVQAVKTVQQLPEDRKELQEKSMELESVAEKSFDIQDAPAAPTAARSLSKKSENLLRSLEMQEKHLYEAIIPQLHEIESSVTAMELKISNQSYVELDLSKWRVQSLLKDLKAYFNRLTIGFTIEGDVKQIIDKINEGMCVLIGVYDRIDSYVEKLELSALMANMATTSHRTGNDELNKVISSLEKIIQTNIILEQYESVVHAFRQHMFPFVHLNMTNCWLTSKSTDNTDADVLVEQAIERIDYLAKQLTSASISIEKYDKDIINIKSDDLYTWKNAEIQPQIGQLLQGDEIVLKADIANGINQNAVKFNEIAINFKVSDDKVQTELNEKLEDFDVTLTMMGNCYYRCGNRSYYVPIDENIVIEYSMKKDEQGHPKSSNEVYRKIKDGTYFLSPYTTWSIKLSNKNGNDFHDLAKLKNMAIDLKLVGNVQYFKYIKAFSDEFSDELLNKHYNFDRIIPYECDEKLLNSF